MTVKGIRELFSGVFLNPNRFKGLGSVNHQHELND